MVAKIVDTEGRLDLERLDKGLLELRNTPNETGISPAQMIFGQDMRAVLPSITFKLMKERRKNYYNLHSRNLDEFQVNDNVRIQNEETKRWDRKGRVVKIGYHRQYLIELTNGRRLWRNRRFLRRAYEDETQSPAKREGVEDGMQWQVKPRRVTFDDNKESFNREGSITVEDVNHSMTRRNPRIYYKHLGGLKK